MNTVAHDNAVRILWDYMRLSRPTHSADVLIVLGSIDDRVAVRAAELTQYNHYNYTIFTGGTAHANDLLKAKEWSGTEAEHFYNVFKRHRGRAEKVLLERRAQNTGENALYSHRLLNDDVPSFHPSNIQLVTKPYMERRALATFEKQWPARRPVFYVTSPICELETYCSDEHAYTTMVNIMVGDMQRIIEYPALGWQTKQAIPRSVMEAYLRLRDSGYDLHIRSE